jgi:hypothetical protein
MGFYRVVKLGNPSVDSTLSFYGVNLSDGIHKTDLAALANGGLILDNQGNVRSNPFRAVEVLANFTGLVQNSTRRSAVEAILLSAFNISFSDGLDASERNTLFNQGILYNEQGIERAKPLEPFELVASFVAAVQASPQRAQIEDLLRQIYNINLSDGVNRAEWTIFMTSGLLYDQNGLPRT